MGEVRWAFSDESERADTMLVTVVVIDPSRAAAVRTVLRGLLLPGQRRVHMAKEGARRQRTIVDVMASLEGPATIALRLRRPMGTDRVAARKRLLTQALDLLIGQGVNYWTLEDVPPSQRRRDNDAIGHALHGRSEQVGFVYDHRKGHEEPILWIADALGWAVGAGGHWRRRIADVVEVIDVSP